VCISPREKGERLSNNIRPFLENGWHSLKSKIRKIRQKGFAKRVVAQSGNDLKLTLLCHTLWLYGNRCSGATTISTAVHPATAATTWAVHSAPTATTTTAAAAAAASNFTA
jgi:hypothetical protein